MLAAASKNTRRLNQKVSYLLNVVIPYAGSILGLLLCFFLSLTFFLLVATTGAKLFLFFKMLFDFAKVEISKAASA